MLFRSLAEQGLASSREGRRIELPVVTLDSGPSTADVAADLATDAAEFAGAR